MTTITKQTFYETYPNFDWKFYVQYNDLKNKIKNETKAIQHYLHYGHLENRRTHNVINEQTTIIPIECSELFPHVKQGYVSNGLQSFEERFMNKFKLSTITNIREPCLFFGVYSDKDLLTIKKHQGLKYIIWGGEDININKFHCFETIKELQKLHNIIHVAISENIYNRLKHLHIYALLVNFNLVKKDLFFTVPKNELGNKIMIFNGQSLGREKIYGESFYIQVMKKLPQYEYILSNQLNVPYKEMPEIYKQCFVMLRLTENDGNANSVQECENMNIPVIHNQSNYGLKWKNVDDIVEHIRQIQLLRNE